MRTLCPVSSIMRKFLRFGRRLLCSSYLAPSDRAYAFSKRTRIVYQKCCHENTHPQRLRALRQNKRPADRAVSPCGSRGLSSQILLSAASDAATGIGLSIYLRYVPCSMLSVTPSNAADGYPESRLCASTTLLLGHGQRIWPEHGQRAYLSVAARENGHSTQLAVFQLVAVLHRFHALAETAAHTIKDRVGVVEFRNMGWLFRSFGSSEPVSPDSST